MSIILKYIAVGIITVLYFTTYLIGKIFIFILPGGCDNCHRKWTIGRKVSIGENDAPVTLCRECIKRNIYI